MALRLAVVTIALTAVSYYEVKRVITRQSLDELTNYIKAVGEREEWLFHLAEDNHAVVAAAFVNRLHSYGDGDPAEEFDRRYVRLPDGSVRSRRERFDAARQAGLVAMKNAAMTADLRRRILAMEDIVSPFGQALQTRFINLWMVSPESASVTFWPSAPAFAFDTAADHDFTADEIFVIATPEHDPARESVWTKNYIDPTAKLCMVSVSTPLYDGDRFLGVLGHDVLLTDLVKRTTGDHLAGAYNVLFNQDGFLIAHPELTRAIEDAGGAFDLKKSGDPVLTGIYEAAKAASAVPAVVEVDGGRQILAVTRLPGPDWFLATVYPKALLEQTAYGAARFVLLGGVVSLFVELGIVYLILRKQVSAPLGRLSEATRKVAAGDFDVELDSRRNDELGRLAASFNAMTQAVRDRQTAQKRTEEALRKNDEEVRALNEALEDHVRKLGTAVDALSTPILEVWSQVLVLPLIGAIDDQRSEMILERLLEAVSRSQCRFVILDVTGVEGIDPATAERLLRVVAAAELLGARSLITGVRPSVARTLVSLGVDFGAMVTLRTLRDGLRECIRQMQGRRPS